MANNRTSADNLSEEDIQSLLAEVSDKEYEKPEPEPEPEVEPEPDDTDLDALIPSKLSQEEEDKAIEASFGNNAWHDLGDRIAPYSEEVRRANSRAAAARNRQSCAVARQKRLDIQRNAFDQTLIPLDSQVSSEELQCLIELLVREHTRRMEKCTEFINRRVTTLLSPLVPNQLKKCMRLFPNSIKMSPGFLYTSSKEYGRGETFWVTPAIPVSVEPGDELRILQERGPQFLVSIDKAVTLYHDQERKRSRKEISSASVIARANVATYYDLLKVNPVWFDILYQHLKSKADSDKENNGCDPDSKQ